MSDEQPPSVPQPSPFKHLHPGRRYVVIMPFTDFDGDMHPAGENWVYLDMNYLPYDRGLSLFVSPDTGTRVQIRLQWEEDMQAKIIDNLESYLRSSV